MILIVLHHVLPQLIDHIPLISSNYAKITLFCDISKAHNAVIDVAVSIKFGVNKHGKKRLNRQQ